MGGLALRNKNFIVPCSPPPWGWGGVQWHSQDFLSGGPMKTGGRPVSELDWQFSQVAANNPTMGCTPMAMPSDVHVMEM